MPEEIKPIDRYGECPECGVPWNDGDILGNLRKLHVLGDKTEQEIVNLAHHGFGYNKDNPKSFSKVIAIQIINDEPYENTNNPDFYMCPSCRNVWDANTSKHYFNLHQAKRSRYEPDSSQLDNGNESQTA